jgi:hypothetical protein
MPDPIPPVPKSRLLEEVERLQATVKAMADDDREIERLLGGALYGYGDIDGEPHPAWGDHVAITLAMAAADEIERLRRWKSEALKVIDEWEMTWEAAGRPGPLGASKAVNVIGKINRLRAEVGAKAMQIASEKAHANNLQALIDALAEAREQMLAVHDCNPWYCKCDEYDAALATLLAAATPKEDDR